MREELLAVPGLPRELDGFTIAHLTDLHGGFFLGRGDLAEVVTAVNARAPDVCAITGDWITHHWSDALPLLDDLGRLTSRYGTFAVFGNHDYKDRLEGSIVEACAPHAIRFLRNAHVRIAVGSATLALVGVEDLEEGRSVDLAAARAGLHEDDVEVLLCHNPSGARALARRGCVLILAGHTHGTQIDLPFLRALGPKHPGARVRLGETTLVVSRGLGVVGVPVRVGAPTEVVLVRLVRVEPCDAP